MHIAVFGATDTVGKAVVVKLIEQNHTVIVFEDGANPFANHPSIRIVQGDPGNAADVDRALEAVDAVICAASSLTKDTRGGLASMIRTILAEMEQKSIWRIVVLGNVVAYIDGDNPSFLGRLVYRWYKLSMPKALRDSEDQARFLQSSRADWTILRAPNLYHGAGKSSWKLSRVPSHPWQRMHSQDVAEALVSQLTDKHYMNQAPFVSMGK